MSLRLVRISDGAEDAFLGVKKFLKVLLISSKRKVILYKFTFSLQLEDYEGSNISL